MLCAGVDCSQLFPVLPAVCLCAGEPPAREQHHCQQPHLCHNPWQAPASSQLCRGPDHTGTQQQQQQQGQQLQQQQQQQQYQLLNCYCSTVSSTLLRCVGFWRCCSCGIAGQLQLHDDYSSCSSISTGLAWVHYCQQGAPGKCSKGSVLHTSFWFGQGSITGCSSCLKAVLLSAVSAALCVAVVASLACAA